MPPAHPAAAVQTTALTKRYGSTTAVDSLDLTIPTGQILALLGPNGAGKSTTTEMILGLTEPDAGSVTVFGQSPVTAIRRGFTGAMLQNGALLDTRVDALLRMMRDLHVHPLPMDDVVERARVGPLLKKNTARLSGGEAQRVRLALGLMGDPQLLLLDEPTVGLDPDARHHFWAAMADFAAGGRTIIFATHYLEEADAFAHRVVVINRGRIIADGTGAEIKARVGGRMISFSGPERDYASLPGVLTVEYEGSRCFLRSGDSDATLRVLLTDPAVRGVEVVAPNLEDAFLDLIA